MNHLSTQQAIDLTTWLQAQPRHDPRSPVQLAAAASLDLLTVYTAANIRHVKGIVERGRPNLDEHERRLRALERKVQRLEVEGAKRGRHGDTCRCLSCDHDKAAVDPYVFDDERYLRQDFSIASGKTFKVCGKSSGIPIRNDAALARGEF